MKLTIITASTRRNGDRGTIGTLTAASGETVYCETRYAKMAAKMIADDGACVVTLSHRGNVVDVSRG
jgi:hypothetical protein